jgi:hypothetical protein
MSLLLVFVPDTTGGGTTTVNAITINSAGLLVYKLATIGTDDVVYINNGNRVAKLSAPTTGDKTLGITSGQITAV